MRPPLSGLLRFLRAAIRVFLILGYSASLPVMAEQNDTQTGVTGTEEADVITVGDPVDTTAEVSTSTGDTLNASATAIDAQGGDDDVSNEAGLSASATSSASLTSQPKETKGTATATAISAGDGDDAIDSSTSLTSTANAFGIYAGSLEYTQDNPNSPPPKEINVSITSTANATGVVTGGGNDTIESDALFAATALATSGGTADQLNSTVRDSVNVKSTSTSTASAKGIEAGAGNDTVTNDGVMLNTATATSGALAIGLVAPQGTPTPDPNNPNAPPKPKKTQIKSDATATATANAVGIEAEEDEKTDSSEDTSPWDIDGLKVTYNKTVSTVSGDDTVENHVLFTNIAVATSAAGSAAISNKVDGTVDSSATSEALATGTGVVTGGGNDTVKNSGELLSSSTATAGALSISLEVGAPSDTAPAPTPPPGEAPKPPAPTKDKENKASSKTSVTATARATGIDAEGDGQSETTTGSAEITDGALVIDYQKTESSLSGNDSVENQGAIQALASATAKSSNASVVVTSGGSTSAESKSKATSYSAAITTGGGNDTVTNEGVVTSSATSNASAITLGLAVGQPQETTPPPDGSPAPAPADQSKLTTSTETGVEAESEAFGIDAEGKATTTTTTRHLSIAKTGLSLTLSESETGTAGNDVIDNRGIMTSTATSHADSTDAAIALEAAGSATSDAESTARATSMGIYSGAGSDKITNEVLLTSHATATADALSIGLTVSKPPEQAPADGGTTPPAPAPDAEKDKSEVKVKAGATAQATATAIDAEGALHDKSKNTTVTLGGNTLGVSLTRNDSSEAGDDTVVNHGIVDVDATATSGTIAVGLVLNAAGSVDADATSKATATSGGILTGGGADTVDNTVLLQSNADATALALAVSVTANQPTDSTGAKPTTPEQLKDIFSTTRTAANAEAESNSIGIDAEGEAHGQQETRTLQIGVNGLHLNSSNTTSSLAGDDKVSNSGAMLVTANSLAGASAAAIEVGSEGTAASDAKSSAKATTGGVFTGGGSDTITNSGELLSSATATAGALGVSLVVGAKPEAGPAPTAAPTAAAAPKPPTPSKDKESKTNSKTSVTAVARATGIDAEGSGQELSSERTLDLSLNGLSITDKTTVTSAAGDDTVANDGAIQALGTATAASRNASVAISSGGSVVAESKAAATSFGGAIATGGGNDVIVNNGILTTSATSNASALTLGLAVGQPQETMPPADGGSGTPAAAAPSKLTSHTDTSVQAAADAFGIDAEDKLAGLASDFEISIDATGLHFTLKDTETSGSAGNDVVLNNGIATVGAHATADSTDAAIELNAVGSVNSDAKATARAASVGIYTGAGNDAITNNALLTAHTTASADSISVGLTVSKPPEQAAGGTTPPAPGAKKDKSNVKVEATATSAASASGIDAEGAQQEKTRNLGITIGGNGLDFALVSKDTSQAGDDSVVNRGVIDVDAEANSGAIAAGIAINAAGSVDADATSKAQASTNGILTGGGADSVDNTFALRSEADATALALAVAVGVSQPTDGTGTKPTAIDQLKDVFATAHSVANATADTRATGIDTEGASHSRQDTATISIGGDGFNGSYQQDIESLAGNDSVINSGAVVVSAGSLAGAGAVEVKVQSEGTASAEANANARSVSGAVLTGGGNDSVANTGALTATSTSTAGALAVTFAQSGGSLGAKAKSDARAASDARAVGIATDNDGASRHLDSGLTINSNGVKLTYTDSNTAAAGNDTIDNGGLVSANAVATTGAVGAAIVLDGSASSDVTATATARADGIDAGGGSDLIGNEVALNALAVSTSNALSIALGKKGEEKTKSTDKAEASSTAESIANGISGDSGTNTVTAGLLEINGNGLNASLHHEVTAASGDDTIVNRGGILSGAIATSGAEGASIAIDGVAKADVKATAKTRATGIDGGGGNDDVLNVGVIAATANSTAGTLAASIGTGNGSRAKVEADTVAEATASGITTDGGASHQVDDVHLIIDAEKLDFSLSSASTTAAGNDSLENRDSVSSLATATTGSVAVALDIKGAANAAVNTSSSATSSALDTGGGADDVLNHGTLTAGASATAATVSVAVSTEGRAISNAGFMGAGTTAKSRAVGIAAAGAEETTTTDAAATVHFDDIGVSASFDFVTDGISADGNDTVTNTGDITATSNALAPRLSAGISGKGIAVSMGRASSESYAAGIDTGNLDDSIDNRGTLSVTSNSVAALANVAVSGKGLAIAANAVWDGGTEAEAVATGINADGGTRTTTEITAEANEDLARVRYTKEIVAASGNDQVHNTGAITTTAHAEAPSISVAVTGTGVSAAVSTATATAESTAIRGGDGDDVIDNSGELASTAQALAAAANVAVTNQGVAIAADAVWDGGTKANATAIGIAGDGGDRTHTKFIAVGTDETKREESGVLADGADTLSNSGTIDAHSIATALSASVAVTITGVGGATATSTSTSRATAIDAGAGEEVDSVDNSGKLTATADAVAAAASVSVTNSGLALSSGSVWDGGTHADARARGIDVGTGAETVTNSGQVDATANATAASASVSVTISGVAGATATSTGTADATALDASAGNDSDTVNNTGVLLAKANSLAASAAVAFTNSGLAIAADAFWAGGTTATARARGIDVGEAADTIDNAGDVTADGSATAASLSVAVTVNGVAGAISTSTAGSDVAAIDAGDDAAVDKITNSGKVTALSSASAYTAAVSFVMAGVAVSADVPFDGGTGADATARGISAGLGADTITNTGDVDVQADAGTLSAAVAIAVTGVAGAIAKSTSTSAATAIDAGDDVYDDSVVNSGALTIHSGANAASAAVSFTAAGVAVAGGTAWDGGTLAQSRASGIALGSGADDVFNEGTIEADATSHSTGVSVAVAVEGVAGAITAATAEADAFGIDAGAGDDDVTNRAAITTTTLANANTISVAGTKFGVSAAGNNSWTGGATSHAQSTGISGGAGLDQLDNSGSIDSTANALSPSVAVSFSVAGAAVSNSTSTSEADAVAIDGGDDADDIDNTGRLTVEANSDAIAVSVAVTGAGVSGSLDAVWEGGTTSHADARGIQGGAGDDSIDNTTAAAEIDATANSTTTSIAASVTGAGVAAAITTSTATADTAAIDGGAGNDTILNDSTLHAAADSTATSVSVSVAVTGAAGASDSFWNGGTKANASAAGIAGGSGDDGLTNSGSVTAEADSQATSAAVAATLSPSLGLTFAVAASTSTALAIGLDAGAGADELTNNGTLHADSGAQADGLSVALSPIGGAVTGSFDAATRANSTATGISGAEGADTLVNGVDAGIELDSISGTRNLAVSLTLGGVAAANANAISTANGFGIDGGSENDTLRNAGGISGTIDANASSRSIALAGVGLVSASASSTGNAGGAGLAGGAGNDRVENLGDVNLTFTATATGQAIGAAPAGVALSNASADSVIDATGQRGDAGADTLINSGSVRIEGNANTTARSISAAQLGVALATANSTATSDVAGMAGGVDDDVITNETDGKVDVVASAHVEAASVSVAVAGASQGEARTITFVDATGLAGDAGDDEISNAGEVSVNGLSSSSAIGVSATVAGATRAVAGTEVETTATGIAGGAGADEIVNTGSIKVGPDTSGTWMSRLFTQSASVGFAGDMEAASAAFARTTSTGIDGGDDDDQIASDGDITVSATALSDARSSSLGIFGSSDATGGSGAFTFATGLAGGAGNDRIEGSGTLDVAAESRLTQDSTTFEFGGSGEAGATLEAATDAVGLSGGAGQDDIRTDAQVSVSAKSSLSSVGGGTTIFGGSTTFAQSRGVTTATGIDGGADNDIVENLAAGSIEVSASTVVDAESVSYTFGGSSGSDNVLTGQASATGIRGAEGSDQLASNGFLGVSADAVLTSRGGAKATFTGSGSDSTGRSVASSRAVGIDGGVGDDVVASRGTTIVEATTVAEAQNDAGSSASFTSDEVAGSLSEATATAIGLDGEGGLNTLINENDLIVMATSTGYALSYSSGASISFDGDGESRADSTARATATGVSATDGNNTVVSDGQITVTATAATAKDLTTTLVVYRLQGNDDENSTPPEPAATTVKALPDLEDDDNEQAYPPGTIVYCTSADCVVTPQVNAGGNHYVSGTVSVDDDNDPETDPVDVRGWVAVAAVDALPDLSDPAVQQTYANGEIVACTAIACREDPLVQASATYWRVEVDAGGTASWHRFDGLVIEVSVDVTETSFPSYAAANGNGLDGDGFATASGFSRADARGIHLGDGNNNVQSNDMNVRAIANGVMNVAADGDVFGDATGYVTTTATARAAGIELGSGDNTVVNAGIMEVSAVPAAQGISEVSAGEGICIWFFGWWCGGEGDADPSASARFDAEAIGILTGNGDNTITNDGTIRVSAAPDVPVDPRRSGAEYAARPPGAPADTVISNSTALGIGTGSGDDVVTNNGDIIVEARDVLSGCSSGSCDIPAGSPSTLSAIGIRTGDGNDIVTNNGHIEALVYRDGVPASTIGIDTGTGNDELALGDGSEVVGSVSLGDGDDTLTLSGTPTIVNASNVLLNADAGAGTDTLVLNGAGSYAGTPLSIERASKLGAGTYSLPALASMQSLTIEEGTLHLDSGYQFSAAGSFAVPIHADGRNGQLDVLGDADLDGLIEVTKFGDTFIADGTRYTVVQAEGDVTGQFSTVRLPEPLPLLAFELEQSAGAVDVVANAASFASVTENPLYRQIAVNLDSIAPESTGDMLEVFGTLQSMEGDFDRAFASFDPESHLATSSNTLVNFRQMTRVLQGHLADSRSRYRNARDVRAPDGTIAFSGGSNGIGGLQFNSAPRAFVMNAYDSPDVAPQLNGRGARSQAWLLGISADSENEAIGGYSSFDTDTSGYLLGYDRQIGERWILGVNMGRAKTDVTVDAIAARGEIDAWLGSAYATWFNDRYYFETGLSYGEQSFEDSRTLIVGPEERVTTSEHDGDAWTAFVGAGLKFGGKRWSLEPYASFRYFNVREDAFEETGADSMNLIVASRGTEALHGEAGTSLSLLQPVGRFVLDWHASLALGYDFEIDDARITFAYQGVPGTAFSIDDRDSAATSTVYGAGLSLFGDRSALSLEYRGQRNSDHEEGFVSARVSIRF